MPQSQTPARQAQTPPGVVSRSNCCWFGLIPSRLLVGIVLGFVPALLSLHSVARAQTGAQLRHARITARGGVVAEGVLTRFSDDSVTLIAQETHEFPIRDVVRLDFTDRVPRLDRRDPVVLLANGDVLAASIEEADSEQLTARWARFGAMPTVSIPLEAVSGLIVRRNRNPAEAQAIWRRLAEYRQDDDALLLANGDELTGELSKIDGDSFFLSVDSVPETVSRQNVDAVAFNADLAHVEPITGLGAQIALLDGSRFHATQIRLVAGELLHCQTQFGTELEFPAAAVCGIRFVGGCATWLSALEPVRADCTPYLTIDWPWRRDRNCLAQPLRLRGVDYPRGLGVHSRCVLAFPLAGQYREFRAIAGIDDSARGRGNAHFQVEVDGERAWHNESLTGADDAVSIGPLDITGKNELVLKVDFGLEGDVLDHADWCDAVLIR